MSVSEAVVEGEAIESDNESDVEFPSHNKNSKVKLYERLMEIDAKQ